MRTEQQQDTKKKTALKCRPLTMKDQHLETRVANVVRQNRDLRAEVATLRCPIRQRSVKNTGNLKWLVNTGPQRKRR